ncbi:MAG: hypothetical protein RIB43_14100 [Rhodospirillaceae bacterium]
MHFLKRIQTFFLTLFGKMNKEYVELSNDGFKTFRKEHFKEYSHKASWSDIAQIRFAIKDMGMWHELFVYINLDNGQSFWISEEFENFDAFNEAMIKQFPVIQKNWHHVGPQGWEKVHTLYESTN